MYGETPYTYLEGKIEVGPLRDDGYRKVTSEDGTVFIAESTVKLLIEALSRVLH
jgi:hypothetical protein